MTIWVPRPTPFLGPLDSPADPTALPNRNREKTQYTATPERPRPARRALSPKTRMQTETQERGRCSLRVLRMRVPLVRSG